MSGTSSILAEKWLLPPVDFAYVAAGQVELHATCVAWPGRMPSWTGGRVLARGMLLMGPSGAGKSDLALRLIDRGFRLVADDRVALVRRPERIVARLPARIGAAAKGLIEVRGVGLMKMDTLREARLALVVVLRSDEVQRLPVPRQWLGLPLLEIDPRPASAALKVHWAFETIAGRRHQSAGAFAE